MPQKNQDDNPGNYSDEDEEMDEYGNTQSTQRSMAKMEKFENKFLEATGAEGKRRNNKEQNRMLKMLISDGKTEVLAIELEKIYGLNLDGT